MSFIAVQVKGMVASLWVVADCFGGIIGSPLGSLTYDNWGMEISTGDYTIIVQLFSCFNLQWLIYLGLEAAGLLVSVILLGIYSVGKSCKEKTEEANQSQGVIR